MASEKPSVINCEFHLLLGIQQKGVAKLTGYEGDTLGAKKKEAKCLNCGLDHDSAKFVKDIEADSTALAISMAREREEKGLRYVG